jgi:putative sterol carrier protein
MSPKKRSGKRPDAAAAMFEELVSKGYEPLLHHASGTLRIDLTAGTGPEHWYVTITGGNVSVSRRNVRADAVLRTTKDLFEGMAKGTVNATAALLRGVAEVEGDVALLTSFSRLFPGPAKSRASFLERQKELSG